MAHYAFLDENNIVTEVITGIDEDELIDGQNPESWYGSFRNQNCKRTSYHTLYNVHLQGKEPFRGNFASIGYTYDQHFDVFIPPRPFPSWKLDYKNYKWEPPISEPEHTDDYFWRWSEINHEWIKVLIDR
jgi:hypothetical protein